MSYFIHYVFVLDSKKNQGIELSYYHRNYQHCQLYQCDYYRYLQQKKGICSDAEYWNDKETII